MLDAILKNFNFDWKLGLFTTRTFPINSVNRYAAINLIV
jgi:hypothetical protein